MGEEGFEPLDSLVEAFRATLAGVFLFAAFDNAGFPRAGARVSRSAASRREDDSMETFRTPRGELK